MLSVEQRLPSFHLSRPETGRFTAKNVGQRKENKEGEGEVLAPVKCSKGIGNVLIAEQKLPSFHLSRHQISQSAAENVG